MKSVYLAILLGIIFTLPVHSQEVKEAVFQPKKLENGGWLIENFQDDSVGGLPKKWYNRDGDFRVVTSSKEEQSLYKYEIREEDGGNKYLHYDGQKVRHLNYPLINKDGINIYETPILSWKWRALKLPEGANEDDNGKNDTVASVYVVFDFGHVLWKKVPKSIRYTWSSTLPVGAKTNKLFGNQQIVVLESGKDKMGKWVTLKRNIVEDYRRLFGDDPPKKPIAILLMSDGDSMHENAIADYDDIELLPQE